MECSGVLESEDVGAVKDRRCFRVHLAAEEKYVGSEGWLQDWLGRGRVKTIATTTKKVLEGLSVSKGSGMPVLPEPPNDRDLVVTSKNIVVDLVLELGGKGGEWEDLLLRQRLGRSGRSIELDLLLDVVRLFVKQVGE